MHWQDYVISSGLVAFTLALIPSIKSSDKPALWTSVLTSLCVIVLAVTFATLSLWATAIAELLNATGWAILAVQKYLQIKSAKKA